MLGVVFIMPLLIGSLVGVTMPTGSDEGPRGAAPSPARKGVGPGDNREWQGLTAPIPLEAAPSKRLPEPPIFPE